MKSSNQNLDEKLDKSSGEARSSSIKGLCAENAQNKADIMEADMAKRSQLTSPSENGLGHDEETDISRRSSIFNTHLPGPNNEGLLLVRDDIVEDPKEKVGNTLFAPIKYTYISIFDSMASYSVFGVISQNLLHGSF